MRLAGKQEENAPLSDALGQLLFKPELAADEVARIRNYLMLAKLKLTTCNIDGSCQKAITEHFVQQREKQTKLGEQEQKALQESGQFVDAALLNRWILMTKIQSCLSLRDKANDEDFKNVLRWEQRREQSLKV